MNQIWTYTIGSVLLVSIISLIGIITIAFKAKKLSSFITYMISFAAGAMIGDAFIHLLPEAVEVYGFTQEISFYVLVGIGTFFIIEKFIHWHHCHNPEIDHHPHSFAYMNLVGDGVHNCVDGLVIGGAYLVSIPVGIATTIAVVLHEIPQEIADFGVLVHGGFSRIKALLLNFITALAALVGALVALIGSNSIVGLEKFLVPFAAGGFIYIAAADLIPELHKESKMHRSIIQTLGFIIGIVLMFLLLRFEAPHLG